MLLDPPSVTGLPPSQLHGIRLYRTRGRRTLAVTVTAAVALALSAFAGVAFALPSAYRPYAYGPAGHGPGFAPRLTLVTPFPARTASARPRSTASPSANPTMPARSNMTHRSKMPTMAPSATPSPTTTTAPATASPSAPATQPTVTVTYRVVSRGYGDLEGEVKVTNTGYSAISGWQIVVALPYDQFTAVSDNASGYVSHHILLLQPASYPDSVPADGTLYVFFRAYGTQTTPELCAFNDITCE